MIHTTMTDPTQHARPDVLDRASGLDETGTVFALRARRPDFLAGAEACRTAVLDPEDALDLSPDLRSAVARRVALGSENARLIAEYPIPAAPDLAALSTGEMPEEARLAAIARHADMIAARPAEAGEADLDALRAAGLSVPQIIALSELLAFVSFQIRVAHGLALLEEGA